MPVFGTSSTIQLDTVVFGTDFSPAAHNAGLYASAISVCFATKLVVVHGFTLVQAAIEAEVMSSQPSRAKTRPGSRSHFGGTFFGPHRPARTTVEAARLPKDSLVEIDAIVLE